MVVFVSLPVHVFKKYIFILEDGFGPVNISVTKVVTHDASGGG